MKNKCEKAELTNCIKEKAKELWKKDGSKQGNDLAYWLQAEKIVKGQVKKQQFYDYTWVQLIPFWMYL